jgi:flagellar FliJ protein
MARFVFPLQSLLDHRERVEQERQRDLSVAGAELVAAQAELLRVETAVRDALDDLRKNHLSGKIDLAYLAAHRRFMLAMQRQQLVRADQVRTAQAKVDVAQRALAEAAKQRKAIDTLREQQRLAWSEGEARKEAAALDEVTMQMAFTGPRAGGTEAEPST